MQLAAVSLDDKYESREGRVHITGSQAIVRLAMMQFIRDRAAGLDTACYITGYRGSPMHNIDKELWSAKRFLAGSHIHFQPAINEDLAATAIWGSQQATQFGDCRHDGVFSLWYGKGPGLDGAWTRSATATWREAPAMAGCSSWSATTTPSLRRTPRGPRVRLRRDDDALPLSLQRARGAELRPARHRALAVLGSVGGLQGDPGHGGCERAAHRGPDGPRDRAPR